MHHSQNQKDKPDAGTWFVCMLVALFMGYVFMQMPAHTGEITRQEATRITGILQSCDGRYQKGHIQSIGLILEGAEKQFVHQSCASESLLETLRDLPEDTQMTLLVHPESHDVLEIRAGEEVLLAFEPSLERVVRNAEGFGFLGIGLTVLAVYFGIRYILCEIRFYRSFLK